MESVLPWDAAGALRNLAPYPDEWLRHPVDDPWWHRADLGAKYARTRAADGGSSRDGHSRSNASGRRIDSRSVNEAATGYVNSGWPSGN